MGPKFGRKIILKSVTKKAHVKTLCKSGLLHGKCAETCQKARRDYNNVQDVILKKSCFIQELISMTRHVGKPADLVQTGPYERSRYHNNSCFQKQIQN